MIESEACSLLLCVHSQLLIGKAAAGIRRRKEACWLRALRGLPCFPMLFWGLGCWSTQGDRNSLRFLNRASLYLSWFGAPLPEKTFLKQRAEPQRRINTNPSNHNMPLPSPAYFEEGSHSNFVLLTFQSMIKSWSTAGTFSPPLLFQVTNGCCLKVKAWNLIAGENLISCSLLFPISPLVYHSDSI